MITIRKSQDRGHFNHGWLESYHTFSFADYRDARYDGFRSLRVINDDKVAAQKGFPTHFHRDMEILTYLLEGSLAHKDSMGNGSTILPGEIQYMSAGRGVEHSEFNPDPNKPCHLLQIWIIPAERGMPPRYSQKKLDIAQKNQWKCLASRDGRDDSIAIRQSADLFLGRVDSQKELVFSPEPERGQWVQLIKGTLALNGITMSPADGAAIEEEKQIVFQAKEDAEFLLFDMV